MSTDSSGSKEGKNANQLTFDGSSSVAEWIIQTNTDLNQDHHRSKTKDELNTENIDTVNRRLIVHTSKRPIQRMIFDDSVESGNETKIKSANSDYVGIEESGTNKMDTNSCNRMTNDCISEREVETEKNFDELDHSINRVAVHTTEEKDNPNKNLMNSKYFNNRSLDSIVHSEAKTNLSLLASYSLNSRTVNYTSERNDEPYKGLNGSCFLDTSDVCKTNGNKAKSLDDSDFLVGRTVSVLEDKEAIKPKELASYDYSDVETVPNSSDRKSIRTKELNVSDYLNEGAVASYSIEKEMSNIENVGYTIKRDAMIDEDIEDLSYINRRAVGYSDERIDISTESLVISDHLNKSKIGYSANIDSRTDENYIDSDFLNSRVTEYKMAREDVSKNSLDDSSDLGYKAEGIIEDKGLVDLDSPKSKTDHYYAEMKTTHNSNFGLSDYLHNETVRYSHDEIPQTNRISDNLDNINCRSLSRNSTRDTKNKRCLNNLRAISDIHPSSSNAEIRTDFDNSKQFFEDLSVSSNAGENGSTISNIRNFLSQSRQSNYTGENMVTSIFPCTEEEDTVEDWAAHNDLTDQCKRHDIPISVQRLSRDNWGCSSSLETENNHNTCFSVSPAESVNSLKLQYKHDAKECSKRAIRLGRKVNKEYSSVNLIASYYSKQLDKMSTKIENVRKNLEVLKVHSDKAEDTKATIKDMFQTLRDIHQNIKTSNRVKDVKDAMECLKQYEDMIQRYSLRHSHAVLTMSSIHLRNKKEIVRLLQERVPVYGVLERIGVQTFSKLSLRDGNMLLHCLRSDVYPNDGKAILTHPFEKLNDMVPRESATIFFDIGWAGERRGKVYILLFDNTLRAQQARLLCSGETGKSYRNTVFNKLSKRGNWLSPVIEQVLEGGDYEENDGSAGRAIVEDICDDGDYKFRVVDGLMEGWPSHEHWHLGSFKIYLKADPSGVTHTGFGIVTRGLDILRAASKLDPISTAYICDCGLVIPLKELRL